MKKIGFKKKWHHKIKESGMNMIHSGQQTIKKNKGTALTIGLVLLTVLFVGSLRPKMDNARIVRKIEAPIAQINNQVKQNIMRSKKGCVISERVYTHVKKQNKKLQAQVKNMKKREKKLLATLKSLSKKGKKKSASNSSSKKRA